MSSATKQMSQDDLADLLTVSRKNNTEKGITGMLLYGENTFLQVLEGEETAIDETFATIQQDSRHSNVTLIVKDDVAERNFSDWNMGFKYFDADLFQAMEGFKNVTFTRFLNTRQTHPAYTALKTFAEVSNLI